MTDIALDEKALEAAAHAAFEAGWPHERERQEQMERNPDTLAGYQKIVGPAIRAYLASPSQVAPQPQVGEAVGKRCSDCPPVGYPTDETRCLPCDRRASPQPANPAQVTDAMVEAVLSWVCDDVLPAYDIPSEAPRSDPELPDSCRAALTAAIGAGGQAVAAKDWDIETTADQIARQLAAEVKSFGPTGRIHGETYNAAKAGAIAAFRCAVDTLSQPHPADERVVEALRAAEALLNNLWIGVVSGTRSHEENWKEFEHRYPGVKGLHDAVAAAKEGR